jgi:hypothetical protein
MLQTRLNFKGDSGSGLHDVTIHLLSFDMTGLVDVGSKTDG